MRKVITYLGPKSQNELINLIGKKIIQVQIVEEIKKSKIHAISADEVTSSNDEIMSIYFRYVDNKLDICEMFLDFGEHIGNRLLNFYDKVGLDIKECCGQCYDGAANMQSQKEGAASFILKESPNAVIIHCCSQLEFIIGIIIDNVLETSPKREALLEHIYFIRCETTEKHKILVGLCKTRWSEHDTSYECFYLAMPFIAE